MRHRRWIVSAVVALLLIYAAQKVDWHGAGATLRTAALAPLGAALALNLVSLLLHGVRWWIFLRRVGPVSLALAVRGAIVGAGLNNLLIASGGEAARALLVARASGVPRTAIVATLALDRVFDPICFGLLLWVATWLIPLPTQLDRARPVAGLSLLAILLLLVLLVRARPSVPNERTTRAGWRGRVRDFRDLVQSLSTPGRFAVATIVSIGLWALQLATFALVARSVGIDLPLAGTVAALLLTNTGLVLRATPGNVGYFQFAYAVAAARFGIATEPAVAAALLLQVVQIVPVTLLALLLAPQMLRRIGE